MKRFFTCLFISMMIAASAFSATEKERKFFGFQFSLGSGYPFYGEKDIDDNHDKMNSNHYNRFIICGDIGFTLKIADPLFFVGSFETMSDFVWNNDYNCNHIDFAFLGGLQFYPGWANFSFNLAYAIGMRGDFVKTDSGYKDLQECKWGNGFRMGVEYDFKKGGGVIPIVGTYWRFMPRGYLNYDNILGIYFRLAVR